MCPAVPVRELPLDALRDEPIDGFRPGPVTPLLAKGAALAPALRGNLVDGLAGVIARYAYGRFTYDVVFARIPESQPFVPRLQCERVGRLTDDTHYGFEIRNTRTWTESEALNARYRVTASPFHGSLLCSIEQDEPSANELSALWGSSATVATRIHDESHE